MIKHTEKFHIAISHRALPGHFPGNPVVPGVILLDRVVATVECVWGKRIAGLPQVKFLRPLLPDQEVELVIADDGNIHFSIVLGAMTIATGDIELVP